MKICWLDRPSRLVWARTDANLEIYYTGRDAQGWPVYVVRYKWDESDLILGRGIRADLMSPSTQWHIRLFELSRWGRVVSKYMEAERIKERWVQYGSL